MSTSLKNKVIFLAEKFKALSVIRLLSKWLTANIRWFIKPEEINYPEPNFGYVKTIWLPNPEILRATIEKVLRAFENVTQTELIRVGWEEIKRLSNTPDACSLKQMDSQTV